MSIRVEVDLSQVMERLERANSGVDQKRQEFVRELTRRLMQRVIDRTPVDTGRAQAGWNEGIGQEEDDGESTQISVTNDVEYINFLEFGTSKMQATAMVRSSMNQTHRDVDSIRLNVFES
jgi:HK97 gp10 family phage protein